jgi:4'-phosphopantetheinyl transferase
VLFANTSAYFNSLALLLSLLVFNSFGAHLLSSSQRSQFSPVTLYFCSLNVDDINTEQSDLMRQWLPEDELAKVSRYIQPQARDKGLMVRAYLRGILSLHSGSGDKIAPQDWRFEYGEKGKPDLTAEQRERTGLKFNISHSGDWLVIALLNVKQVPERHIELGVDIERCRASTNIYPILNHYFTQVESDELLAQPESLQRQRFFDLWALKESYIKAKGMGLALSLKSFSFDFSAVTNNTLRLSQSTQDTNQLVLFGDIKLNLIQKNEVKVSHADNWNVSLGRLNEEYRFAVSVSNLDKFELKACQLTLADMLADRYLSYFEM